MNPIPASPLSLNQLTREYWGQFDAAAIAQLAQLATDPCYQVKFYKAPADDDEVMAPFSYVPFGLSITTGSVIFGLYLPCEVNIATPVLSIPPRFTLQVTDVSLQHKFFDDPVAAVLLANFKPVYQSDVSLNMGSFPNLLRAPHPVVGSGMFDVEIQSTSDEEQRIEVVFGVLEVCGVG